MFNNITEGLKEIKKLLNSSNGVERATMIEHNNNRYAIVVFPMSDVIGHSRAGAPKYWTNTNGREGVQLDEKGHFRLYGGTITGPRDERVDIVRKAIKEYEKAFNSHMNKLIKNGLDINTATGACKRLFEDQRTIIAEKAAKFGVEFEGSEAEAAQGGTTLDALKDL